MNPDHPTIHLVDDDPSFLKATSRLLGASGYTVRAFVSADEFIREFRPDARGCLLLDLHMPGLSGLDVQAALEKLQNPLPVVFLTAHGDIPSSVTAMRRGAEDFLVKPVQKDALLDAVARALARGEAGWHRREEEREWRERYASLTPREREVFALVVRGLPNKRIADEVQTSERTVKAHRAAVMHKMQVQSPAELGRAVAWLGPVFEAEVPVRS